MSIAHVSTRRVSVAPPPIARRLARAAWQCAAVLLLIEACVGLLLTGPVHAEPLPQPLPEPVAEPLSEYETAISDALAAYRAGRYQDARVSFMHAHQLKPSARTLRGLGQSAFGARQYAQAISDLTAAQASNVNMLTPAMMHETDEIIARARVYTGRFWLKVEPADAVMTVDGQKPVLDHDGALLLDVGFHHIVVRAPKRQDREVSVQVVGGEERKLALAASPMPETPSETDSPSEAPEVADHLSAAEHHEHIRHDAPKVDRPFPWLAVGAYGLAAVGVGVGLWNLQLRSTRSNSWAIQGCPTMPTSSICRWFDDKRSAASTRAAVAFTLAGAFAVAGTVLLVVNQTSEPQPTVACGIGGSSVACSFAF